MFSSKFLKEIVNSPQQASQRDERVLIVDSMNTFIRSFSTINTINSDGQHIGGLIGYLKSIGFAIKLFRPTRVILVFDGKGNSNNKKNLYPDYKANRHQSKITNWEIFSNKEEESESMTNQMTRLIQYLKQLPVTLISIDKIEADDSIGFLVNQFEKDDICKEITIYSADKDFYQLLSNKTQIYSPTKKKVYKIDNILEEFGVHPNNYLLYKVLLGDQSDNVPGVRGMGPKKAVKLFSLRDEEEHSLEYLFETSKGNYDKNSLYGDVLRIKNQLNINYQLMNIRDPNISPEDTLNIKNSLKEKTEELNVGRFVYLCEIDGVSNHISPNVHSWVTNNFGFLIRN